MLTSMRTSPVLPPAAPLSSLKPPPQPAAPTRITTDVSRPSLRRTLGPALLGTERAISGSSSDRPGVGGGRASLSSDDAERDTEVSTFTRQSGHHESEVRAIRGWQNPVNGVTMQ